MRSQKDNRPEKLFIKQCVCVCHMEGGGGGGGGGEGRGQSGERRERGGGETIYYTPF